MPGISHVQSEQSLPTLRLSTTQKPLTCSACGKPANSLLPVCLWCFSDDTKVVEDPVKHHRTVTSSSAQKGDQPYGLSRGPEAFSNSQASISSSPIQYKGAPAPVASQAIAIAHSRLSVDLRDESLMDALSTSFPMLLKQQESASTTPVSSDKDAPTRLITPSVAQSEDKGVAMFHPSIPHATSLDSLEAGSSSSASIRSLRFRSRSLFSLTISSRLNHSPNQQQQQSPPPTSISTTSSMIKSVARRLSSSTSLRPQVTPPQQHETYTDHTHGEGQLPLSDGDALDQGHRSLHHKMRLDPPSPVLPHSPVTPHNNNNNNNNSLVSKSSLYIPPPISISLSLGQSRPGTAESSSSSNREAVIITGDIKQELLISAKPVLTLTSSSPRKMDIEPPPVYSAPVKVAKSPPLVIPAPQQQQPQPETRTSTIRWSTDEDKRKSHKSTTSSTHTIPPVPAVPIVGGQQHQQQHSAEDHVSSPTSSRHSSISTAGPPNTPRVGHPSRPYYSAIRKHCMSSPASSRPSSVDHGRPGAQQHQQEGGGGPSAAALGTRDRPSSSAGAHPPSAFSMSSITPFTRRPVSIGVLPSSTSSSLSGLSSAGQQGAASGFAFAKGMSVFDIEDDAVDDEDGEPLEPSGSQRQRKSISLSRAFIRPSSSHASSGSSSPGKKKRRRWSSSLFTESSSASSHSNNNANNNASGNGVRGGEGGEGKRGSVSHGMGNLDRMGISMSGETELRMALAVMQQQEEEAEAAAAAAAAIAIAASATAAAGKEPQQSGEGEVISPVSPSKREKERKYRFRQTVDISGQHQHQQLQLQVPSSSSSPSSPSNHGHDGLGAGGNGGEGRSKGRGRKDEAGRGQSSAHGVMDRMKKIKRGLKGFLTSSSSHASPTGSSNTED